MKKQKKPRKPQAKKKAQPRAKSAAVPQNVSPIAFLPLPPGKKRVLHVGCGDQKLGAGLHETFRNPTWVEVRLDIDPTVKPDIVSDMRTMPMIPDSSFDAVWSSHNIEHVWSHEVTPTLAEFFRVLKPDGCLAVSTPDLGKVAEEVEKKGLDGTLYQSPTGPIAPLDIFYGFRPALQKGHYFMAHKTGFTAGLLGRRMTEAGFLDIRVQRHGYNLTAVGYRRAERTEKNGKVQIIQEDINAMMQKRDDINQPPSRKYNFKFKRP